jgi:hypothetical protein
MWMDLKREARDEKQETSNVNMNVSQIVAHLIQTPAARQEIWAYAVKRGLGNRMQSDFSACRKSRDGMAQRARTDLQKREYEFPRAVDISIVG